MKNIVLLVLCFVLLKANALAIVPNGNFEKFSEYKEGIYGGKEVMFEFPSGGWAENVVINNASRQISGAEITKPGAATAVIDDLKFVYDLPDNKNIDFNKDYTFTYGFLESGMVTDKDGNRIIVGGFNGVAVDFGVSDTASSKENSNMFIVKYDKNNNVVFLKNIGGKLRLYGSAADDYATDVKVDSENNIYVLAAIDAGTEETVDMDPEHPESNSIITTGMGFGDRDQNIYIIKYSPLGELIWFKEIKDDFTDVSYSLFVDSNNDVWATGVIGGYTLNSIDFDTQKVYDDNRDVIEGEALGIGFVAHYKSSGEFVDVKGIGNGIVTDLQVCIASSGNMYLAGSFNSNKTDFNSGLSLFNNSVTPTYIASQGYYEWSPQNQDIFLLKWNTSGTIEWVKTISSISSNTVEDIAVYGDEYVCISGVFSGSSVDFDTDNSLLYDTKSSAINGSGFVATYNANGKLTMLNTVGGGTRTRIHSLDVNDNGVIVAGGDFMGTISLGDSSYSSSQTNPFIAFIDASGNWSGAQKFDYSNYASIAKVEIVGDNKIQYLGFEAIQHTTGYDINTIFWGNIEDKGINTTIKETNSFENLIIYPNPASDIINIKSEFDITQVIVFNIEGRPILSQKHSSKINISNIPVGIYLLKIFSKNNEVYYKRVIIK